MLGSIFDTFRGLPTHVLIVHAVVVLVPLVFVGVVIAAISRTWRQRLAIPILVLLAVGLVASFIATRSGRALRAGSVPRRRSITMRTSASGCPGSCCRLGTHGAVALPRTASRDHQSGRRVGRGGPRCASALRAFARCSAHRLRAGCGIVRLRNGLDRVCGRVRVVRTLGTAGDLDQPQVARTARRNTAHMVSNTGPARPGALAVVTGAGSGIGRATALRLAEDGWTVSLVDRDPQGLADTASRVREVGGCGRHSSPICRTGPASKRRSAPIWRGIPLTCW